MGRASVEAPDCPIAAHSRLPGAREVRVARPARQPVGEIPESLDHPALQRARLLEVVRTDEGVVIEPLVGA